MWLQGVECGDSPSKKIHRGLYENYGFKRRKLIKKKNVNRFCFL